MVGDFASIHVVTGLDLGGAERLLTNVVIRQHRDGKRSLVVSMLPGGAFREVLEKEGVTVVDLGFRRRRISFVGVYRLVRLIRRNRPEVVQAWMYHANFLALIALHLSGLRGSMRLIWGVFSSEMDAAQYHWSLPLIRKANALLSRFTDGVVYNAASARDYHRAIGFREPACLVTTNFVDTEEFCSRPALRAQVRDELGIADEQVVIIAVARVDPKKDWKCLRQAVCDMPGVTVLAVGKGTESLPGQDGFIRLGMRKDIHRLLAAADIFALSSAFGEGTSLALSEAIACGLPCVVTDVGDNGRTLGSDGGIVVPPRVPAAFRAALQRLSSDAELRRRMGKAGRSRMDGAASAGDVVDTLERFSLGQTP